VSTDGRRDYLVPQPSLSLPARPISACTTPCSPGQNLNTSAIPAPPTLIPQPSPPCLPATSALHALPCPLCPLLLFSARLALSFLSHFIRDGGGNQQLAIVPSELNTNIYFLLSQALSNACHSFKVTLSFLSLARPRATASLLRRRCSSPTGACPICATHRPQDPHPSCFRTCAPTLVHRRTTRHEARVPNGVCVYRISPVPITHHLTSASDQGYLDTNLWWKRENQGRRRHTRSRRGDLGTGHQNRETPRRAKSRQGRSGLFSPAQPQPTWQGRCRAFASPSRGTGLLSRRQTFRLADRESSAAYQLGSPLAQLYNCTLETRPLARPISKGH